ncbi:MAG: hypothetical protein PHZ14_04570 [Sulfuricella sp.]|nr:hypothetical protein [Sulfuricella sp.]
MQKNYFSSHLMIKPNIIRIGNATITTSQNRAKSSLAAASRRPKNMMDYLNGISSTASGSATQALVFRFHQMPGELHDVFALLLVLLQQGYSG